MAMTEMRAEVRMVWWPAWLALPRDLPHRLANELRGSYRKWRTAQLLGQLDRTILEDIGVPHENVSPASGSLDRYPDVIKIRQLGI
ncbi:MAG: hypothetical protein KDK89_09795 [Alphaproteobacteria bacterium]|nr:hypothetical protein [Alphaproteobacteria bacterium]